MALREFFAMRLRGRSGFFCRSESEHSRTPTKLRCQAGGLAVAAKGDGGRREELGVSASRAWADVAHVSGASRAD